LVALEMHKMQSKTKEFPPLETVSRPTVPTDQAAHYLLRQPQTLRYWAMTQTYPDGLAPVRVGNRLGWPVTGIKAALGVAA
jgi:hypothetical protein